MRRLGASAAMRLPEGARCVSQLCSGEGTLAGAAEDRDELKDADALQARCGICLRDTGVLWLVSMRTNIPVLTEF